MKKLLKLTAGLVILAGAGFAIFLFLPGSASGKEKGFTLVPVEKGSITDKALATGQIVPEQEIQVKSQISGIVKVCYVQVGDRVKAGDRLFQIIPDPTPLELTEAERNVELAQVTFDQASRDMERTQKLLDGGILPRDQYDATRQEFEQAGIRLELARQKLALLREGKVKNKTGQVDSVIRAPTSGTVLERLVDTGDPVVPLTTFQEGTALLTLADMDRLVFKGTVDEIDVGKLHEGQPVRIKIGALPDAAVGGALVRIAPKAKEQEGATLFDVEVEITERGGTVLRAGYSANADIIIQEKADVLLVPERLVSFEEEKAFVELPAAVEGAEPERREIQVGLSDGLNIEVVAGLDEDAQVVQRPPRQI